MFVAGAGGDVSGIQLSTNQKLDLPKGPKGPVTCIKTVGADSTDLKSGNLYAGSWDKSIWQFPLGFQNGQAVQTVPPTSFAAHTDFVKCIAISSTPDKQPVLISGGADGDIRFWTPDGKSLGSIRPQRRGIEYIVSDPYALVGQPVIFFSTSQRDIYQFDMPNAAEIGRNTIPIKPLPQAHETSVYKLQFDSDGDLWTASADKTCKRLVRENGWVADTTLQHPDFVKDVVTHDEYGLVLTACRDEEIRVWDKATSQLRHIFSGHFEEVTALALAGDLLISVSIDSTLRRWSLAPQDLRKAIETAKEADLTKDNPEPATDLGMLTAEEEAELRALMEDEEADALEKMAVGDQ